MKKKTRLLACSFLVGTLLVGAVSILSSSLNNNINYASALEGEFVPTSELPETYAFGTTLNVPNGKISYEGKTYNYNDYYLTFPNGKSLKQDSYLLDVAGSYDLTYVYETSSKTIYSHYDFIVYSNAYTLKDSTSYVEYHEQIKTTHHSNSGLHVDLASGDTFTYNNVVDAAGSSLEEPLFTYYPYAFSVRGNPANEGKDLTPGVVYQCSDPDKPKPYTVDANGSVVRIEDAYDPSIYFEVFIFYRTANMANNRQQQYAVAGPYGQTPTGLEKGSTKGAASKLITFDGETQRVWAGTDSSSFGTTLNTRTGDIYEMRNGNKAVLGSTNDPASAADLSNADDFGFSIYYDEATKRVYIKHVATKFITDLDDPALYPNKPFKGFTTGEVKISLSGMEYNSSSAKYDIGFVKGVSNLGTKEIADTREPIIKLENENNNFHIAVGEEFNLFDAEVIDYNYNGDLEKVVYYEYGTSLQIQVPVINNKFTPTKPGTYTVLYRARDTFGNESEKTLTLYAITTATGHIVDFAVDEVNTAEAGQVINLPAPRVVTYNNDIQIKSYAVFEDGEVTNINTSTWALLLKKVGEYKIVYEYTDGILSYTHSYTLTSTASNNFYLEEITFPKYIIKDASYSLDTARVVKVLSKELTYDNPTVYISEDGGDFSRSINPKDFATSASNTVQFKYVYDNKTLLVSEVIKVKDVNFKQQLNKQAYFDLENMSTTATSSTLGLETNTSSGDASATFINSLNFSSFYLKFDLKASTFNAERFEIVLTDYMDENNTYVISIYERSNGLFVNYNNEIEFSINRGTYSLIYDPLTKTLSDTFENQVSLDNPFTTNRFYLTYRFVNLEGLSSIYLTSINNQPLNQAAYDTKGGNIVAPSIENTRPLGTLINLEFFYPEDVFSPYLEKNYKISVTHYVEDDETSEPQYVASVDGVLLDGTQSVTTTHTFKLEKVGVYQVSYSYDDQRHANGALKPLNVTESKFIYSVDDLAPVITLKDGYNESTIVEAKLGSTHTVKGYEVSDDNDESPKVTIRYLTPSNEYKTLEGRKLKLTERGDYKIIYYAEDMYGNITTAYYTVRVK